MNFWDDQFVTGAGGELIAAILQRGWNAWRKNAAAAKVAARWAADLTGGAADEAAQEAIHLFLGDARVRPELVKVQQGRFADVDFPNLEAVLRENFQWAGKAGQRTARVRRWWRGLEAADRPDIAEAHRVARDRYLRAIVERCARIRFTGLGEVRGRPDAPLVDLFEMPRVVRQREAEWASAPMRRTVEGFGGRDADESEKKPLYAYRLLTAPRVRAHSVLLGKPGAGKTTLTEAFALAVAAHARGEKMDGRFKWAKGIQQLPVVYRVRDWVKDRDGRHPFKQCLDLWSKRLSIELPGGFFDREADTNGLLLLIDGLDEAIEPGAREQIREEINACANALPEWSAMVVTSRPFDYQHSRLNPELFAHFELRDFDEDEVERLVRRWSAVHAKDAVEGKESADKLVAAIQSSEKLGELTGNALLLAMIIRVHFGHGQLPENRRDLYDRCVDTLLEHWSKPTGLGPGPLKPGLKRQFLAKLAWVMQSENAKAMGGKHELLIPRGRLMTELQAFLEEKRDEADPGEVIDRLCRRDGVLVHEGDGRFRFIHRSFQEFFAAEWMVKKLPLKKLLEEEREGWRETLCLAIAGIDRDPDREELLVELLKSGRVEFALAVLNTIVEENTTPWLRSLVRLLARYYRGTDLGLTAEACAKVCRGVDEAMEVMEALFVLERRDGRSLASVIERAKARSALGDKRAGAMCARFFAEAAALRMTGTSRMVRVDDWWVDAYLVTNAEYERMIPAHRAERSLWSDEDEQPVIFVNWWEARLFAEWSGCELVPDALWQRAACDDPEGKTGPWKYPWGNKWLEGHANTSEAKIGKTSKVGAYLEGRSRFGCFDMAGNVWEWTADEAGVRRWVRGGSWNDDQNVAACDDRYEYFPTNRYYNVGFRRARTNP